MNIKWQSLILIIFLMFGYTFSPTHAAKPTSAGEYQIKAVYLYNFTLFIRWPNTAFDTPNASFRFCILGEDPFQYKIDMTVKNETVQGRSVIVQRLSQIQQSDACQILFISQSERSRLAHIIAYLEQEPIRPILTVSDISDFLIMQGGMIKFYSRRKRVRLAIDPDALEDVGLKASARLLQISKVTRAR
jgi:hypothetical protein